MFKFNNINCRIKSKICSKLTIEATNFILVSLLLTVTCCSSVFFANFEHVNGRWNTLLHWYKFMHFRVRSRNHVTFKTKLYVTTVNNSFQSLPNFCQKELHLRCCIGFGLNIAQCILHIVAWSTKIWKGFGGHVPTPPPFSPTAYVF